MSQYQICQEDKLFIIAAFSQVAFYFLYSRGITCYECVFVYAAFTWFLRTSMGRAYVQ